MPDEPSLGNWLTHTLSAVAGFLATPAGYYAYKYLLRRRHLAVQERHQQHLAALDTYRAMCDNLAERVTELEKRLDDSHVENLENIRKVAVLEAKVKEQQAEIDELRAELSKRTVTS